MTKKCILYITASLILLLASCSSQKVLEGNWETFSLIKDGKSQKIFPSNIKFIFKDNEIKATGDAGVNLYKANIRIKGKSFSASNMENTGFQGLADEMEFENLFFTILMNADSFNIEDGRLFLIDSSNKAENTLIFVKKE